MLLLLLQTLLLQTLFGALVAAVIVLTRRSGPIDLVRGALSGCDAYLVKPVTLQTLRETVARCMRKVLSASPRVGDGDPAAA